MFRNRKRQQELEDATARRIEKENSSKLELAAARALRAHAKRSTAALLQLVYKSEITHEPVIIPPHQAVAAHFMDFHRRSNHIWPVNHGKTGTGVGWALRKILQNPNSRGAVVSATQAQAKKVLRVLRGYIDNDPDFRWLATDPETGELLVRRGDMWTDSAFEVARESGIKDPTVAAVGIDGGLIMGSRIDWLLIDDLLNLENTYTQAQRNKVYAWVDSSAISRVEPTTGQMVDTNSAWHPDDVNHRLEKYGWATLRMAVDGALFVKDDAENLQKKQQWDNDLVEPWLGGDLKFGDRLRIKHEAKADYARKVFAMTEGKLKPSKDTMLWNPHPEIRDLASLELKHPVATERKRLYYSVCRDDADAHVKQEWVDQGKATARKMGFFKMPKARVGSASSFITCGVDLAVSEEMVSADTVFFVLEILPSGHRLPQEIRIMKKDVTKIRDNTIAVADHYNAYMRVESNGAQKYLVGIVREKRADIYVRGHNTGKNKHSKEFGLPALFAEIENGSWLFPCGEDGVLEPNLQRFVDAMLYFSPEKHTDDTLMAAWLATEQAKAMGFKAGKQMQQTSESQTMNFGSLLSR